VVTFSTGDVAPSAPAQLSPKAVLILMLRSAPGANAASRDMPLSVKVVLICLAALFVMAVAAATQ